MTPPPVRQTASAAVVHICFKCVILPNTSRSNCSACVRFQTNHQHIAELVRFATPASLGEPTLDGPDAALSAVDDDWASCRHGTWKPLEGKWQNAARDRVIRK